METLDLGYAMQNNEITVYVDANNAARIQLAKRDGDNITEPANEIQLDDRDRFFHIIYPDQEIPDGTSVEIRVTKNMTLGNGHTYNNNLIKYTLIFDEGTELVEMPNLRTFYPNRTEDYLSSRYDLLTELNFDYDPVIGNQYGEDGNQYYHFPIPWEASSYGFHDGGPHRAYSDNATLNKDVLTLYESNTPVGDIMDLPIVKPLNTKATHTLCKPTFPIVPVLSLSCLSAIPFAPERSCSLQRWLILHLEELLQET